MKTARLLAIGLFALSTVLACSSNDSSTSATDLAKRLDSARSTLAKAPSLRIDLAGESVPQGVNALQSASGIGDASPAFDGDVAVDFNGSTAKVAVIAVNEAVYVKGTFLFPKFTKIDPASIGAPDPATFFAPESGVLNLLNATHDLTAGDKKRDGGTVVTAVNGTIAGNDVHAFLPTAEADGQFDVTYLLNDDNELRKLTISGPFYDNASDATYAITLEPQTEQLDVQAP